MAVPCTGEPSSWTDRGSPSGSVSFARTLMMTEVPRGSRRCIIQGVGRAILPQCGLEYILPPIRVVGHEPGGFRLKRNRASVRADGGLATVGSGVLVVAAVVATGVATIIFTTVVIAAGVSAERLCRRAPVTD